MVKKWVPTFDGHDMELVPVKHELTADELAFMEELRQDVKKVNENSCFSIVNLVVGGKINYSPPPLVIRPNVTRIPHHPKYLHAPDTPENMPDLTYAQLDRALHVLGEYFPPEKWEVSL